MKPKGLGLILGYLVGAFLLAILPACHLGSPGTQQQEQSVRISGRILNHLGEPRQGTLVYQLEAPEKKSFTDGSGSFEITNVRRGSVTLMTSVGGVMVKVARLDADRRLNDAGDLYLDQPGNISGQLVGVEPRLGIEVYIPGTSFMARTDELGKFTLYYVPAGCHRLIIEMDGRDPIIRNGDDRPCLRPGQDLDMGMIDVARTPVIERDGGRDGGSGGGSSSNQGRPCTASSQCQETGFNMFCTAEWSEYSGEGNCFALCGQSQVCPSDSICVMEMACFPTCSSDADCGYPDLTCAYVDIGAGNAASLCVEREWLQSSYCQSDAQCGPGYDCVNGLCQPDQTTEYCRTDSDCAQGYECVNGVCQHASTTQYCRSDSDCPAGQACLGGICSPCEDGGEADGGILAQTCRTAADCPAGFVCTNGYCTDSGSSTCELQPVGSAQGRFSTTLISASEDYSYNPDPSTVSGTGAISITMGGRSIDIAEIYAIEYNYDNTLRIVGFTPLAEYTTMVVDIMFWLNGVPTGRIDLSGFPCQQSEGISGNGGALFYLSTYLPERDETDYKLKAIAAPASPITFEPFQSANGQISFSFNGWQLLEPPQWLWELMDQS